MRVDCLCCCCIFTLFEHFRFFFRRPPTLCPAYSHRVRSFYTAQSLFMGFHCVGGQELLRMVGWLEGVGCKSFIVMNVVILSTFTKRFWGCCCCPPIATDFWGSRGVRFIVFLLIFLNLFSFPFSCCRFVPTPPDTFFV